MAERWLTFGVAPWRGRDAACVVRSARELERLLVAKPDFASWNIPYLIALDFMPDPAWATPEEILRAEAIQSQAVFACVLERLRASSGGYPAALAGLTLGDGRPLPPDPMTGGPMHYRTTDDARYILWSVGFDGQDDHGTRALPIGKELNQKGDWVWSFAP